MLIISIIVTFVAYYYRSLPLRFYLLARVAEDHRRTRYTEKMQEYGQWIRFACVGASGVIVNLLVLHGCLALQLPFVVCSAIAFLVSAGSNYCFNRAWTFNRDGRWWKSLLVASVSLCLSVGTATLAHSFGVNETFSQLMGVAVAWPFNYLMHHHWVFAMIHPELVQEDLAGVDAVASHAENNGI